MKRTWGLCSKLVAALICAAAEQALAQGVGAGVLQGLGKALEDIGDSELQQQRELELARKKAEIEIETQKKLISMRQQAADADRVARAQRVKETQDRERELLVLQHPEWVRIVNSNAFRTWMASQLPAYKNVCMSTWDHDVVASCINDFFDKATFRR